MYVVNLRERCPNRQIIDDFFELDEPLPHIDLEESAETEDDRQYWREANIRYASCTAMYKWLDQQGILKKEAFCYDVMPERVINGVKHSKQVMFAVDSKDLVKYKDAMLASGIDHADVATAYILAESDKQVYPSDFSGAVSLSWTMKSYRESCGMVSSSWETLHERGFYDVPITGLADIFKARYNAEQMLSDNRITVDDYFDVIKQGVKDLYKLDRTAFLRKVPEVFVKDTKNPDYKSVMLSCDKRLSDNGYMRITVASANVYKDYGIVSLGDFESDVNVSVRKGNEYKSIKMLAYDVVSSWTKSRKEYAERFKATYGAAIDLNNVSPTCISKRNTGNKVTLDNLGFIYVDDSQIDTSCGMATIHYASGLDKVYLYNVIDGELTRKTMSAHNLVTLWNDVQVSKQNTSEQRIKSVAQFDDLTESDVQESVQNDGLN